MPWLPVTSAVAVLLAAVAAPGAADPLAALPLRAVRDGAAAVAPAPGVVMFWRADCGPCLRELSDLASLRRAAAPTPVTPVGLQPPPVLRPALARIGLGDGDSLWTAEDAARVLTRYGGAPPRLPLAVAFGADGRECGRHTGYLGTDQLRAWARACGATRARG